MRVSGLLISWKIHQERDNEYSAKSQGDYAPIRFVTMPFQVWVSSFSMEMSGAFGR